MNIKTLNSSQEKGFTRQVRFKSTRI